MIPKIIHYCWFGGNPLPDEYKGYIETWKKYCPDYEIREWNENNFDVNQNIYCKEAYEAKNGHLFKFMQEKGFINNWQYVESVAVRFASSIAPNFFKKVYV